MLTLLGHFDVATRVVQPLFMNIPSKQAGIDRRDFLQYTGGGLLLSVLATKTSFGFASETVKFASDGFSLEFDVPHGGVAALHSLRTPKTNFEWVRSGSAMEPTLTAAGESLRDWTIERTSRQPAPAGDRFELVSRRKANNVRATTALQAFTDSPVVQFQTEFQNVGNTKRAAVTALGPLRLALRDDIGPLQVHAIRRDAYALETNPLDDEINLSGGRWNAPEYCGLLLIEAAGKDEFLLIGVEWERGWRFRLAKEKGKDRDSTGTWLTVDLADLTHDLAVGEKLSTPRVFLGLAHGDREQAFLVARHYMEHYVFPAPLQNWPWVVYDFWATDAKGVEAAALHEVDFAAKLGVDVFVHDASWYSGSSKKGTGDWGCGLGNYTDDREKFPRGLAAVSRTAHDAGLKFGLWVGPNVVDSRLIGTSVPKHWTAQLEGKDLTLQPDGWESAVTQVCLGCREYIDFLKDKLTHLVREFDLNWLKWDNSGIPKLPAGCDRVDHGHQSGDSSYAALVGQYEIFDHLHHTFPDLVLEQCGYGSRLDYGLARTIRANWLSDSSYPSEHVRQNALVAGYLYPSADNGAWIVVEDKALLENVNDPAMLDTIFRSRMMSLFGFGTILGLLKERISLFPQPILDAAKRNMEVYKRYRHLLQHDCYHLQPVGGPETGHIQQTQVAPIQCQAVQFVSPSGQESVVFVFKAENSPDTVQLSLRGLQANGRYDIAFANGSPKLQKDAGELLSKGIAVTLTHPATSEVMILRMQ